METNGSKLAAAKMPGAFDLPAWFCLSRHARENNDSAFIMQSAYQQRRYVTLN